MSKIIFNGVDYAGGSGNYFNPVIYSDTERKIGVWRDNKPLYQRTFVLSSPITVNGSGTLLPNDIQTALADVEIMVDSECARDSTYSAFISPYVYKSGGQWYVLSADNWGNVKFITLRYTKTTDVAGSGDYNTYGVPTVHYSTSEQVVGTWTDGKPLYQKTLEFNGSYSGASGNVPINIANLDTVFIFNGWGINSSGAICPLPYVNNQTTYLGGFFISSDKSNIGIRLGTGITFTKLVFTIQYTKTTD